MKTRTVYHTTIESFNESQATRRRIEREERERKVAEQLERRARRAKPKKRKGKSATRRRGKSKSDAGIMPWVVCFLLGCAAVYLIWLV